jgi:cell division septal protein FtsQ
MLLLMLRLILLMYTPTVARLAHAIHAALIPTARLTSRHLLLLLLMLLLMLLLLLHLLLLHFLLWTSTSKFRGRDIRVRTRLTVTVLL